MGGRAGWFLVCWAMTDLLDITVAGQDKNAIVLHVVEFSRYGLRSSLHQLVFSRGLIVTPLALYYVCLLMGSRGYGRDK